MVLLALLRFLIKLPILVDHQGSGFFLLVMADKGIDLSNIKKQNDLIIIFINVIRFIFFNFKFFTE